MQVPAPRRFHWRLALAISVGIHVALGLTAWLAPQKVSEDAPDGWRPKPVDCHEIDVHVMDIYEPIEVCRPGVVQFAPAPATAAVIPTVDPPAALPSSAAASASGIQQVSGPGDQVGQSTPGTPEGTNASGPLFPVSAAAKSVVYVIDRSGSMGERGRLTMARQELEGSLQRLAESVRFQVILYNRRPEILRIAGRSDLVPATLENISQATRLLREVVPEGGTEHLPALRQALLLHPDMIYFLTDADDLNPADVQTLTRLNQGRTVIHAIELTLANRDHEEMPMHRLARDNRGGYRAVEPAARLGRK
ncbi:hypothetical protein AYO44_01750 [Planctomycetaceae bacterium SCGC AG-212-F19]|nr:hypothetical protein AYO44_01750 [Planctomycetaceae bacterium SCGC AG-212-F19]